MSDIIKGKSLLSLPEDYTIIDLETTGYVSSRNEIIEISALKCRGDKVIDVFSSLVKPENKISNAISNKTGITNEMVENEKSIKEVLPDFLTFLGSDIIIGHNVNFDINFLCENTQNLSLESILNDFVDTLRISRMLRKDEEHHKLSDLCERYGVINKTAHRALSDCEATLECYIHIKNEIIEKYGDISELIEISKPKRKYKSDKKIVAASTDFDENHPIYGKNFVITGSMNTFKSRDDLKQFIVNLGGKVTGSVTSKTDYLINNDPSSTSSKNKKATELNIPILSEVEFLSIIVEYEKGTR